MAAHCQNKDWCNPTFKKMYEWFGKSKSEKTIETAMTGLVKKGVVVRGYKGERKRFRLTYRINNPSVTSINQNPPKVKKATQGLSLNVRDQNPSKVKKNDPPKIESIRDNVIKDNIKEYSKSNEGKSKKEIQKIERLNTDWKFKARSVLNDYDWFVEVTGKVITDSDKEVIAANLKQMGRRNHPEWAAKHIIQKIYDKPYFGKSN